MVPTDLSLLYAHCENIFKAERLHSESTNSVSSRLHQPEVNNWLLYSYTVLSTLQDTRFTDLAQASFVHSLLRRLRRLHFQTRKHRFELLPEVRTLQILQRALPINSLNGSGSDWHSRVCGIWLQRAGPALWKSHLTLPTLATSWFVLFRGGGWYFFLLFFVGFFNKNNITFKFS